MFINVPGPGSLTMLRQSPGRVKKYKPLSHFALDGNGVYRFETLPLFECDPFQRANLCRTNCSFEASQHFALSIYKSMLELGCFTLLSTRHSLTQGNSGNLKNARLHLFWVFLVRLILESEEIAHLGCLAPRLTIPHVNKHRDPVHVDEAKALRGSCTS